MKSTFNIVGIILFLKIGTIEPHASMLELSLLVRECSLSLYLSRGAERLSLSAVFYSP